MYMITIKSVMYTVHIFNNGPKLIEIQ